MKPPLHVLLSAIRLTDGGGRKSGNYYHALHLFRALAAREEVALTVLADDDSWDDFSAVTARHRLIRVAAGNVVGRDVALVSAVYRVRPDVFHKPTGALPVAPLPCRTIAGIADLNFTVLPTRLDKRVYKELTHRWTARAADHIVCISEYTRQAVLSYLGPDPSRVSVVHLGTNELTGTDDGVAQQVRTSRGAYWLTFAQHRHKNVETALRVVAAARARGTSLRLVVVGSGPYVTDTLRPLAQALEVTGDVVFAGTVTSGTLRGLYENAEGLLFPSTYEGFGLPILEAMALGCPVIASNACSLAEVAGDAAILVDPHDAEGMAVAAASLQGSGRQYAIERGRARASLFTWARAAEETVALYERVAHDPHRRGELIPASRAS